MTIETRKTATAMHADNVEVASSTVANEDAYQLDIPVPPFDIDDSDDETAMCDESVEKPFSSVPDDETAKLIDICDESVEKPFSSVPDDEIGDLINLCDDNATKFKVLYGETLLCNRKAVTKTVTSKKNGKTYTFVDQKTKIVELTNDAQSLKIITRASEHKLTPGTTYTFKGEYKADLCFYEWICVEPGITYCHEDSNKGTMVVDNTVPFKVAGYHPHLDIDIEQYELDRLAELGVTDVQYFTRLIDYCKNDLGSRLHSRVSIYAYTSSAAVHKAYPKCPCYTHPSKVISMHVVFFDIIIPADDLSKLFVSTYPVHKYKEGAVEHKLPLQTIKMSIKGSDKDIPLYGIDDSIFKFDGVGRKFRHCLSGKGKYVKAEGQEKGDTVFEYYPAGCINEDDYDVPLNFTSQLIHPCGTEKVIYYNDVIDGWFAFPEQKPKPTTAKVAASTKANVDASATDDCFKSNPLPITKELFDTIIDGFDSTFKIHNYCTTSVDEEVTLYPLIKSINACESADISREYIEAAFDKIRDIDDNLTDAAKRQWNSAVYKLRKDKNDSWTGLLKILRKHNTDYFNKHILPMISAKESFITSDFTFDDYKSRARFYRTRYQHLNALARCIAVTTDNDYIVKRYSGENVVYTLIRHRQMHSAVLDFVIKYEASEDDKNRMRDSKKKVTEEVISKVGDLLNYVNMTGDFKLYSGMALRPSSHELWSYRPPLRTEYNRALIVEWIEFMKNRVVNVRPLMEEIYAHAYRLRNPSKFIEKFFVHRGPHNAGKSFLAGGLGMIYPGLAQVGGKTDHATKDLFNSWISERLLIHFEEADTNNYRNQEFETFVKQITSPEGSGRAMFQTTKAVKHTAIVGMNTNDPTIFGLIRADEATIDRLVIIEFKEPDFAASKWCEYSEHFYSNPAFAYSLYYYLLNELEIPDDFCYSRYRSPEKYEFIKAARANARNSVELWIETVVDDYKDGRSKIAFKKKFRVGEYVYMQPSNVNASYRKYVDNNRVKYPVQSDGLKNALIGLGFEFKPSIKIGSQVLKAYVIKEDAFMALSQTALCEVDDDFICDDEMDHDEQTCDQQISALYNQQR